MKVKVGKDPVYLKENFFYKDEVYVDEINYYIYDLYGVCNHSGGVLGGHYTSYIRTKNNKWYLFNDKIISEVKNTNCIISAKAYCLFYRKKK